VSERITVPHQVYDTVHWIVKDREHYGGLTEVQRNRLLSWAKANRIDPMEAAGYPVYVVTRHYPNGERSFIHFTEYLRDSEGHRFLNADPADVATAERSVEQRVPFGEPC
jgi:hypothetical protein